MEDLAWAKWAFEQGHAIAYVAEAEVIHVHSETPRSVLNRYRREAMAFKRIYPEAHFSLYDFIRMISGNITSDLWHAALQRVFWRTLLGIFWFRAAQFWGTYQGYRQSLEWNWQLRQTFYYPHGMEAPQKSQPRAVDPIQYNK